MAESLARPGASVPQRLAPVYPGGLPKQCSLLAERERDLLVLPGDFAWETLMQDRGIDPKFGAGLLGGSIDVKSAMHRDDLIQLN